MDGDRNVATGIKWREVQRLGTQSVLTHLGDDRTDYEHRDPRHPYLRGMGFQDPEGLGGRICGRNVDFSTGGKAASHQPRAGDAKHQVLCEDLGI